MDENMLFNQFGIRLSDAYERAVIDEIPGYDLMGTLVANVYKTKKSVEVPEKLDDMNRYLIHGDVLTRKIEYVAVHMIPYGEEYYDFKGMGNSPTSACGDLIKNIVGFYERMGKFKTQITNDSKFFTDEDKSRWLVLDVMLEKE